MVESADGMSHENAQKYADKFMSNDLTTKERLAKKLQKDINYLDNINEYDVEALIESLLKLNLLSKDSAAVKKYISCEAQPQNTAPAVAASAPVAAVQVPAMTSITTAAVKNTPPAASTPSIIMEPTTYWNVRVRQQPSFESAQVGLLPNGKSYKFLRVEGNWAKLATEEYDGLKSRGDDFISHNPATEGWCAIRSKDGEVILKTTAC